MYLFSSFFCLHLQRRRGKETTRTTTMIATASIVAWSLIVLGILVIVSIAAWIRRRYPLGYGNGNGNTGGGRYYTCEGGRELTPGHRSIFSEHGMTLAPSAEEADLFLPCSYSYAERELSMAIPENSDSLVYAIPGMDNVVSKDGLWLCLVRKYGLSGATQLMPMTYVLYDQADRSRFIHGASFQTTTTSGGNAVYIVKKNIQRQEGLLLMRKSDLLASPLQLQNLSQQGYVVLQEFMDDPYLIAGHKINLRVYVFVKCRGGQQSAYMYPDGFVYYTPKVYMYSTDPGSTITTGYSRELYEKYPLSHSDLRRYLGFNASMTLFHNIRDNIKKTMKAVTSVICTMQKGRANFQLFGTDFQINQDLSVRVLEWNKGPSMSEFDTRDAALKKDVQAAALSLLGIIPLPSTASPFDLVWSSS